ncbi:LysR family transcriptional regulator [Sphingomonas sp. Y38-1Y]|uniref:LysR family transcriptional regulator n=1 Tax=Sphingomonas sp. Y38-1Y TaxID=3078265 RepID=UPI0028E5647E|nr:LysR family transcriptional regulator [Sphingomonas sp. Y38-1Y]
MSGHVHDLNLRHLRAALAVIETGTVIAAAQAVSLSQPALTQGIARLEAALRTSLFTRRPDGMTPTPAGLALGRRVEAVQRLLAEAMKGLRRGTRGFARADLLLTMAQLRALVAMARGGSYVAAAATTGVSQPAIHRAIRDIERICGTTLVERRGRGVALTAAGVRLARACRLALNELRAAIEEIAAIEGRDEGRIAIGAMPLARAWLLPTAIARFHAAEPGVAFDVAEGSHAELLEPLRDGEFDLLVGAIRDPVPGPDIAQEALLVDRLAIFGRTGHPLAGTAPDAAALARQPWLVPRAGTPLRSLWEGLFANHPLPPVAIECGSVMMLRNLMLEGDYLTLLSPEQLWVEVQAGVLTRIADVPDSTRVIGVTTRAAWHPTGAQARFIALLRDLAQSRTLSPNQ